MNSIKAFKAVQEGKWIKRKNWEERWLIPDPRWKTKVMVARNREPPRDISDYEITISDIIADDWEIDEEMSERAIARRRVQK